MEQPTQLQAGARMSNEDNAALHRAASFDDSPSSPTLLAKIEAQPL